MLNWRVLGFLVPLAAGALASQSGAIRAPSAEIHNGAIRAQLYLPNTDSGYYRGSRFDWSGVIASLEYKGHNFFGVWFPHYDPRLHDAITGPVEEFRSGPLMHGSALGFEEAKPGEFFVKIGMGVLRKPDDKPYAFVRPYDIMNHGTWTSRPLSDRVEFEQEVRDDMGYAYRYRKIVRLAGNRPELVIEHRLQNTGKRAIETDVYNHDFYVIDSIPTGPDTTVKFTFAPKPVNEDRSPDGLKGKVEIRGNELRYTRELQPRESAASWLGGYEGTVKENDIRVENRKAGVGVREIGDRPLSGLNFWSIRTTVCPEAFVHLKVEPGKSVQWSIRYLFYDL